MFVIRDVMHCKPGMVKPMIEKFQQMSKLVKAKGLPGFRVTSDYSGAPFWTVVIEFEAPTLAEFQSMQAKIMGDEELRQIMAGYHDLVDRGSREIYRLEV